MKKTDNFLKDLVIFAPEVGLQLAGLSPEEMEYLNLIYKDAVEKSCWCMTYDEGCYMTQDLNLTTSEAEEFI